MDVIQPLLLGGKARCLDGVFLVAAAALALVMGQLGVGRPHDAIALVPHPEAEVHIVEGHGKLFVQPFHLVPHAGPDQQAGTRDGGEVLHGSGAEQIAAAARLLVLMAMARVAAQTRDNPRMQARAFLEAGAKNLHVVDLDGAKDGTLSNYDTIAALAKQGGLYIEVGGGIRTEERIEKYLSLGVGRCILGSVAVTDLDFTARMLKKYGEKIAVGVDAKDGYVAIHGWKDVSAEPGVAFCQRLAEAGCKAIIYTDIACDGAMKGTNLALYRQLAKEVPGVAITASGGISSEKELLELEEMGTAAAILGKSLYTGALDLGRCVALVQK